MNLGDLLSELRQGILNDRTDRTSGTSDYLWTDDSLVRYINEAQRRFAMRGLVIRDGVTDEVTKVTLVENQTEYELHESILAVISAKREDQDADLSRVGHPLLSAYRPTLDYWYDPARYASLPAGAPLAYSTDESVTYDDSDSMGKVLLRIYPKPNAAAAGVVIRLRVIRLPIEDLRVNANNMVPEVPREHHLDMLDWAAYLALRIVDDDAGNPKRAQEFRDSFEGHVQEARNNVMRKLFAPMPWGFGRAGWSWEA